MILKQLGRCIIFTYFRYCVRNGYIAPPTEPPVDSTATAIELNFDPAKYCPVTVEQPINIGDTDKPENEISKKTQC